MSAQTVSRFCPTCGSQVGSSSFCSSCGAAQPPADPARAGGSTAEAEREIPVTTAMTAEPRRRRIWPFAAAALALVAIAGVALALTQGDDAGRSPSAAADGRAPRVETFRPRIDPDYIAFGGGALWVAESDEPSRLGRYDPRTNQPLGGLTRLGDYVDQIAFAGRDGWVAGTEKVSRIDGRSGELTGEEIETPIGITTDLVGDGRSLWHVDYGDNDYSDEDPRETGQLVQIDTRRGEHGAVVEVPDLTSDAAASGRAVYVGSASTDFTGVSRVTGSEAPQSEALDVGTQPQLAATSDAVWVTNQEDGTVLQLDAADLSPRGGPIDVGNHPRGIAVDGGIVWVAVYGDDAVVRLDERTGRRVGKPIPVGDKPDLLVAGAGRIWVRNSDEKTISVIDAQGAAPGD